MVRICMFLLMVLALVNPSLAASSKDKKTRSVVKASYASLTLHDHISVHCKKSCVDQESLLEAVHGANQATGVDYKMLLAIIQVESAFNPRAKNGSNVGLNQVNLRYHRSRFTPGKYYDVQENVMAGAEVYRDCWVRYKQNKSQALRCYNGFHLGDPQYVSKVSRAYDQIKVLVDLAPRKQEFIGPVWETPV